jgi:D-alanyl-D-alanine carboxypeptidase/D-alanyl-D-alanine-endopeptidase (penicillin-binding protein 4)
VASCTARGAVRPLAPEVAALAAEVDSALADPAFARASWGVVVQSLDNGQVLYRRNAERLFLPASNLKILTAAAALVRLGADFRYRTVVLARGTRRTDTLAGDLVVAGRGDPTLVLDTAQGAPDPLVSLRPWADSLEARGIRVIQGRVAGDATPFTGPQLGPGWAWDDLDADYSAPVGALQFNESVAYLVAVPGQAPGEPVRLSLLPRSAPLRLFATATTAARDSVAAALRWSRGPFGDSVSVAGSLPAGHDTVRLPLSVPDPTRYFETSLTEALAGHGVAVAGASAAADAPTSDTLFVWTSPPLSAVLPLFLKPSQNQIGETLLRTLGAVVAGVGSADSGRAVTGRTLSDLGVPPDAYVLADGSGLSRYDFVTPDALAQVLFALHARPDFQAFYDALPVAGVDGTLATRLMHTAAAGNVHAKTGSLTGVRALSGYVQTADGEHLLFVLLANNFTAPQRVVEAAQDRIVERLANFSRASEARR